MPVTVYIPTSFRQLTHNQASVEVDGADVGSLLANLKRRFPHLGQQLFDSGGEIPDYINIYVNNREISTLQGKETPLCAGDEVALIPAMAGGQQLAWTPEQVKRYSRHLILSEVGSRGQRKLLAAKVLLVGAGGLGSPAALYLAAAGVGTLGIADFDVVDLTNLQRQILHHVHDVGRPKVVSAAEAIADINADIRVVPHPVRLSSANMMDIIAAYDVVVDGSDNFPTRYLINDACVLASKPNVHGSIFRFEGQATVFLPQQGCYRCLYPAPPPPGTVPSCAEAGVLGVLPGIVGCMQAIETIKLILGLGEGLVGRLVLFDALTMTFREVRLRRDPHCPLCGANPTIKELIDYDAFCGLPAVAGVEGH